MKKDTTPNLWNNADKNRKVVAPSKKTIAFLKHFARSYYVEKSLPVHLGAICVN